MLLNRLGIVSARQLASARPWTVIGIFVFAAVATPSTDPLTMLFLAIPMTVLYLSRSHRQGHRPPQGQGRARRAADDEASPLDDETSPLDD